MPYSERSKAINEVATDSPIRKARGNLIVLTGPSGVGKGTVVQRLLKQIPKLTKSVSVTTRDMRPNEKNGVDYFFHTDREFKEMIKQNKFLEWAEFAGHLYGTPHTWVMQELSLGNDVILEIEVKGAKQIRDQFSAAILIFLSPPTFEELKSRLKGRATETAIKMALRLAKARQELREKGLFEYEVVNDNVDEAVANLAHIVYAERNRIRNLEGTRTDEYDKNLGSTARS